MRLSGNVTPYFTQRNFPTRPVPEDVQAVYSAQAPSSKTNGIVREGDIREDAVLVTKDGQVYMIKAVVKKENHSPTPLVAGKKYTLDAVRLTKDGKGKVQETPLNKPLVITTVYSYADNHYHAEGLENYCDWRSSAGKILGEEELEAYLESRKK